MLGAGLMIGHQVSGKAVRDSFFLSYYPASALPKMVITAAVVSFFLVLIFSSLLRRLGPRRLVPVGFILSALAHFLELFLVPVWEAPLSIVIYLHIVGLGAILLSGFWSLVTETFDPRTAKDSFGRIAGAGTAGGILGGLGAERVAALFSATDVLALLGALHLTCGIVLMLLPAGSSFSEASAAADPLPPRELFRRPYLMRIAALVVLSTASAAILDYLFKAGAGAAFGKGAPLLRFFAIFYTTTQLLTFLAQTFAARYSLRTLGIGRTISSLPLGVGAGSLAALFLPVFPLFAVARSLEQVLRGSLFRSAYELLYTPVPPVEKRAAKTLIDVACDRAGDALGSGVVQILLVFGTSFISSELLGVSFVIATAGVWIATRLDDAYTGVVQQRLVDHAVELDLAGAEDSTTRSVVLKTPRVQEKVRYASPATLPPPDPALTLLQELRSGDRARVLSALRGIKQPEPMLAAQILRLLAWDEVAAVARDVLVPGCRRLVGLLTDHLTDQEMHFAIRRRVPPILGQCDTELAVRGLLAGLADSRFEVRFQCSRALDSLHHRHPELNVPEDIVFAAVERELLVARPVWESRHLLDRRDESDADSYLDEVLRERAHRSLEHVFSLFAAVLPREPVKVAFRAIHTDDSLFRGLAFEFLDGVLPPSIRHRLWELIERQPSAREPRPPQEAVAELLRSQQSLLLRLGVDPAPNPSSPPA